MAPFSFPLPHGGEDLRPAPLVYVPDLVKQIFHLLDQNDRLNNTTVHISWVISHKTFLTVLDGLPGMGK